MYDRTIAILQTTKHLDDDVVLTLVLKTISLIKSGDSQIRISTDFADGVLKTEGKKVSLGAFYGQQFDAEIATDRGPSKVSFIFKSSPEIVEAILMNYAMPKQTVGLA